jgi:hypothetical protein
MRFFHAQQWTGGSISSNIGDISPWQPERIRYQGCGPGCIIVYMSEDLLDAARDRWEEMLNTCADLFFPLAVINA